MEGNEEELCCKFYYIYKKRTIDLEIVRCHRVLVFIDLFKSKTTLPSGFKYEDRVD